MAVVVSGVNVWAQCVRGVPDKDSEQLTYKWTKPETSSTGRNEAGNTQLVVNRSLYTQLETSSTGRNEAGNTQIL